ncbi:MAG: DUF1697 domain-containing protein [Actinobacteria bacterium]|nr:DUF1697 domain-containing protein [Actinomycetota bacterium]
MALLRGINLAGTRRIVMADLRRVAEDLGWTSVATHLQSGNLVFHASGSDAGVAGQLRSALAAGLGLDVDVVIRDAARLRALVDAHPYRDGDPARVVIACCDRPIEAAALTRLAGLRAGEERFQLADSGCDLYASFPDGQARSRLASGLIGALAPATGTARNLRTMTAVADLLRAEPGR